MRYLFLVLLIVSNSTFAESFAEAYKRYTGDYPRGSMEYELEYEQSPRLQSPHPGDYSQRNSNSGTMWYTPQGYSNQYGTVINSYGSNGEIVNCYATRYGVTCGSF